MNQPAGRGLRAALTGLRTSTRHPTGDTRAMPLLGDEGDVSSFDDHLLPRQVEGLVWSVLDAPRAAELAALVSRIETADGTPVRTSAEEVESYFAEREGFRAVAGDDGDGVMRAFGLVRPKGQVEGMQSFTCSGGVDDALRLKGAGFALVDWQVSTSRALLASSGAEQGVVVVHVDETETDLRALLEEHGFRPRRWYVQMRRSLALDIPGIALPQYVSVEPWTADLAEQVRRAHGRAFADQPEGAMERGSDLWGPEATAFEPRWSFVALDRSSDRAKIAGYIVSSRYEQDWEALGWTEGYTEVLGVLSEWRGKHVGSALLSAAMRAYAADGMEYAGLDVDVDFALDVDHPEPHSMMALYTSLDYVPTSRSALHVLELGAP
ncbi:GNAT family N-acetyltransferase [Georgenia sp. Z1491]|uniref:GNAT family N-acetyltransferase n=1 Tax=Georgenia sp. Z1491 TaxID=3416707 RepID=UPI003CEFAF4B